MGTEAGWEVPLSFGGALEEAVETRRRAGVFDRCPMGRIRIRGDGALDLLEWVCTADVAHQEDLTSRPTLLCNEDGGILDAGRLLRMEDFWVLLTSPPCRQKVLEHLRGQAERFDGARVDDQTLKTTALAVEGPRAGDLLAGVAPFDPRRLAEGQLHTGWMLIARYIAERYSHSRTWGATVLLPNLAAGQAWRFITAAAGDGAIRPAGLAAWDVLRVEAGRPRYGYELNETITPYQAALGALVDFGHEFLGAEALQKLQGRTPARVLAGLAAVKASEAPGMTPGAPGPSAGPHIPRQGEVVCRLDGPEVGRVTSATFSPTRRRVLALAYVAPDQAEVGTHLRIGEAEADVVDLPFVAQP